MSASEIYILLANFGIPRTSIKILDARYRLPSSEWLARDFAEGFEQLKKSLGTAAYVPEVNDCDDFSLLAHWYATHLHKLSDNKGAGIAFGTFTYIQDAGGAHQINAAVVDGGKLAFFEPQNSKLVDLSEMELLLCSEVRL